MSPRILRRVVWLVFVAGIAGMIVASIKDSSGGAITAGIITAIAAGALILVTAVAPPGSLTKPAAGEPHDVDESTALGAGNERLAVDVEARITALVSDGANEEDVRTLVARAIAFGRQRPPRS
jgi:hypothetical protein